MNILVLPSWYPPHGGGFFKEQCEALAEANNEVRVLAVNRVSPRYFTGWFFAILNLFFSRYSKEREGDVEVVRMNYPGLPLLPKWEMRIFVYVQLRLFEKVSFGRNKRAEPNVIHVHSAIWAGVTANVIKQKYGIPYVITEHRGRFCNSDFVAASERQEMNFEEVKDAFVTADSVLCVSQSLVDHIAKLTLPSKIKVLGNMVDTELFKPSKNVERNSRVRFLTVANLVELKGVEELIRAFSRVCEKRRNVELVIVGEGKLKPKLLGLVGELQLTDRVIFRGRLSKTEVRNEMIKADVFALTSRYESFGVVYIEAMSCGLPVVATKSGGGLSLVKDFNGLLAEIENVESIYEKLIEILESKKRFDPAKIRNFVIENYSKEFISSSLISSLSEVARNREISNV